MRRALAFFFALFSLTACQSKEQLPPELGNQEKPPLQPGVGGGGRTSDGGVEAGADGGACNALANTAPVVTESYVGEALPQPLGGNVTTGNYALTAANVYTGVGGPAGPTGRLFQETLGIVQNQFDDVSVLSSADAGAPAAPVYQSGTFSTQATAFVFAFTCPSSQSTSFTYSATASVLRLYQGATEFVFTLQ